LKIGDVMKTGSAEWWKKRHEAREAPTKGHSWLTATNKAQTVVLDRLRRQAAEIEDSLPLMGSLSDIRNLKEELVALRGAIAVLEQAAKAARE
jgi:hypothetical protein